VKGAGGPCLRCGILLEGEDDGGHGGGPHVGRARGGDRRGEGVDDLAAHEVDLAALVVADLGVEIDAEGGGEHGGGQILGEVAQLLHFLAEAVVLGDVAVVFLVGGDGHAHGGADQPALLVGLVARHDAEGDLPGVQGLLTLLQGHQLAVGRIDARHIDQVLLFDARLAQGQLEGLQFVFVDAHALREEGVGGNHGVCGHSGPSWA